MGAVPDIMWLQWHSERLDRDMGIYADRMTSLTVSVVSPDNKVRAVLSRRAIVEIQFRPGSYLEYSEPALEPQLASLAGLLNAGRHRAVQMAVLEATGCDVSYGSREMDRPDRELRDRLAELEPVGLSSGRCLKLTCTGMANWRARIRPGTLLRWSEAEFGREFAGAYIGLQQAYRTLANGAKRSIFSERESPTINHLSRRM